MEVMRKWEPISPNSEPDYDCAEYNGRPLSCRAKRILMLHIVIRALLGGTPRGRYVTHVPHDFSCFISAISDGIALLRFAL